VDSLVSAKADTLETSAKEQTSVVGDGLQEFLRPGK
jgi:hypothetical protein